MIQSFDFIADERTEILVIGSMPGVASLNAQQYYAHPRNLFWMFLFEAFATPYNPLTPPTYDEKITFALQHHIGFWDAAHTCSRTGSLDTHIKNVVPNDFQRLFSLYPQIHTLLFNGKTAFNLFSRFYQSLLTDKKYFILPSTSPANASIPLDEKRELWMKALSLSA